LSCSDCEYSEGNYQAYIEDLNRRKGPDADQPHRIAYRKLVRA
jgi:energy-dependent translational throttle protein EttA